MPFPSGRTAIVSLMFSLNFVWLPLPAMADIVVAGSFDTLDVQAVDVTAKDFIVRLGEVLGIPIRYEGIENETVNGSRTGSLFRVLSQYFPQHVIVVRSAAGQVLEATIMKTRNANQAVTLKAPTPAENQQATQALIPLHLIKGRGF